MFKNQTYYFYRWFEVILLYAGILRMPNRDDNDRFGSPPLVY